MNQTADSNRTLVDLHGDQRGVSPLAGVKVGKTRGRSPSLNPSTNAIEAPSSAENRQKHTSPSSTPHPPRFTDANIASTQDAPFSSVSMRRAQLPPLSQVVVRTGRGFSQTKMRTPPPRPPTTATTTRRNIYLGDRSGGYSTTELPKPFPRPSATEPEKQPDNKVPVLGIGEGVAVDSELQEERPEPGEEEEGEEGDDDRRKTWPGSDFKLEHFFPGSVYLWACGEHGKEGGGTASPVSRSEAAAAWVILITQALCYVELFMVSEGQPSDVDETADNRRYSLVAVAVATYLMLSIAGADLWGGFALVLEGRGSGGDWFWRRKIFGAFLLSTFLMLVAASTRVLFYSSFEDFEVVIGAAAVLFIADVDERIMVVLKNLTAEWRLFWVLEVIGLSFGLAVLMVKVTRNDGVIDNQDEDKRCDLDPRRIGCDIYAWSFILTDHSITTTMCALFLTHVLSRSRSCLRGCFCSRPFALRKVVLFAILLWWGVDPVLQVYPHAFFWGILLGLCAVVYAGANHGIVRQAFVRARRRLCAVDRRRRAWLFGAGLVSIVLRYLVPASGAFIGFAECLFEVVSLQIHAWLLVGMGLASLRSSEHQRPGAVDHPTEAPRIVPMLLGWGCGEFINLTKVSWYTVTHGSIHMHEAAFQLITLAGMLTVGTFLWGGVAGRKGVAYWTAATVFRGIVIRCAFLWVMARAGNKVT